MILFLKVIFRVIGRAIWFSCAGASIMTIYGFMLGLVWQLVYSLFIFPLISMVEYLTRSQLQFVLSSFPLGGMVAIPAFLVSVVSYALAGVISGLRDSDTALGDVIAEAAWGSAFGAMMGAVLWPCSMLLLRLRWIWENALPAWVYFPQSYNSGTVGGFCVGIFFGAIFGAFGKQLPTHRILPTLRQWLKMSTHGK